MAGRPAKTFPIIDSKGNVITTVTGWNHGTVADGCELTDMTIDPICSALNNSNGEIKDVTEKLNAEINRAKNAESAISSRVDVFYDEYSSFSARVETSAFNLNKKIDDVSAISRDNDNYLSAQIDTLKAATDVIAVFGTYEEFTAASAGDWQQQVTDNDFVKVLNGKGGSKQVYYEWHDNTHTTTAPDWKGWSAIGELDPYYSKSEVDNWRNARFTETSANYALLAANTEKLGGTVASDIINSAKSGAYASAWLNANAFKYISNVASSNMQYIDGTLVTATDGSARKLTISLSGYQTTGDGTYITGSTNNRLITLKPADSFIGSAQSGKSAYDWITTKSATLSAGQYIQFTNAAANTLGIKVTGLAPYTNGNYIEVDNTTHKINLSSNISAENMSADNIMLAKQTMGQGSYTANLTFSSMYMQTYGQPPIELLFDAGNISAWVPDQAAATSPKPTLFATNSWYNIISNVGGNFVSAASSQQINVVTALELPSTLVNGVYYLI